MFGLLYGIRGDYMEINISTIVAIIITFLLGAVLFYFAQGGKINVVEKMHIKLNTLYEIHREEIENKDPILAGELKCALDLTEAILEDGKVSILEAIELSITIYPLIKKVVDFVENGNEYGVNIKKK